MATKGERQALLFLAAVALLGAGTRVYRARRPSVATDGLDRQIAATREESAYTGARRPRVRRTRAVTADSSGEPALPVARIDVDRASAAEIERLPGIGPAMARRIVGDREANGPFGCLAALDVVKGIGPALLARLDTLTTFSGPARAACVRGPGAFPVPAGPARRGVRRR